MSDQRTADLSYRLVGFRSASEPCPSYRGRDDDSLWPRGEARIMGRATYTYAYPWSVPGVSLLFRAAEKEILAVVD